MSKNFDLNNDLLWKYLSQDDLEKLNNLIPTQIEKFFAEKFNLDSYQFDLKQACFLDYYVTQYWWASKEKSFSIEQITCYFSIVYILMNNLKEKRSKLNELIQDFKNMLSSLNEKTKLFTDNQLKDIVSHVSITIFQNFKLFKFVLNEKQDEVLINKEILVECPKPTDLPYPPPLDEAMPNDIFNKHILKIPDAPTPEEKEREKLEKPELIEIPDKVIEQIHDKFQGLTLDEAKKIIFEVTNELITDLKTDLKTKIKERESVLISELSKNQPKTAPKK